MALSVISLLRSDSVAFGCEADMRTVDRSNQSDVNDPQEPSPAQGFRTAKALFVPWMKRDIVPSIACTRPPTGGVAWQSTSDGENSYSHWAARQHRSQRARSSRASCPPSGSWARY